MAALARRFDYPEKVKLALREIVWSSSLRQSVKSIFTAGFVKSVVYSYAKFVKMLKSIKT